MLAGGIEQREKGQVERTFKYSIHSLRDFRDVYLLIFYPLSAKLHIRMSDSAKRSTSSAARAESILLPSGNPGSGRVFGDLDCLLPISSTDVQTRAEETPISYSTCVINSRSISYL
jgi:hypothetical protein